jgi:hypothetical protein
VLIIVEDASEYAAQAESPNLDRERCYSRLRITNPDFDRNRSVNREYCCYVRLGEEVLDE